MAQRKIGNIFRVLLSVTIILFYFLSFRVFAAESRRIVNIEVFPDLAVNEYFYGFGVETLPWLWTKENREAGVNEKDIRLNLERIREMRLPITRIFVPWETWNPSLDYKTFTWESDEMHSLYNMLELYQKMQTKVILVTVDWCRDSPWKNSKASAEAVLELLEHLIHNKGYSCIQFWTLTNEPELTYGWLKKMPFEKYVQIHRLLKQGLEEKGLAVSIIASDDVESPSWFKKSVQSLSGTADVFSSHIYPYPAEINALSGFFKERLGIAGDTPFFLCEFGFRGADFGACSNSLIGDYEYGLYTADLCIEALNSGIDAVSLWCLHQIRLIDEINPEGGRMMRIGLWAFKDEGWRPFPVFYLYRQFTRYIKSGSRVLKIKIVPANILKAACVENKDGSYSIIISNMADEKQTFLIKGINFGPDYKKYLYTRRDFSSSQQNLPERQKKNNETVEYLNDMIPSRGVVFYTNEKT